MCACARSSEAGHRGGEPRAGVAVLHVLFLPTTTVFSSVSIWPIRSREPPLVRRRLHVPQQPAQRNALPSSRCRSRDVRSASLLLSRVRRFAAGAAVLAAAAATPPSAAAQARASRDACALAAASRACSTLAAIRSAKSGGKADERNSIRAGWCWCWCSRLGPVR